MRITPHTFVGRPFERATGFAESKGTVLRLSPSAQKRRTKRSLFKIPVKKSRGEFYIPVYIKGIAEHLAKGYDIDRNIAVLVLEMLKAIDAYKTSELYNKQESFSQLKRFLSSGTNIQDTDEISLFSLLTKYIACDRIDFSFFTILAGIYPTAKGNCDMPAGAATLVQKVADRALGDIKA
jgi:hypothetical protein